MNYSDTPDSILDASRATDFAQFRAQYPEFTYHSFKFETTPEALILNFHFEIPGLADFHPQMSIPTHNLPLDRLDSSLIPQLVFSIGLVELISYWKATCSPRVIIKCGNLTPEQIAWWRKLYFNGLGELFYRNQITTTVGDFMEIVVAPATPPSSQESDIAAQSQKAPTASSKPFSGYLVPIGGGKDSVVTLETLPLDRQTDYCFIINPKPVTLKCAELASFGPENIITIHRTIDPTLIDLNRRGFINGHTPFSALLAFSSYLVAYLLGKKYVAVSNESSANEANVISTNDDGTVTASVNHQYSKSLEFENDFRAYATKYFQTPVEYFSFLRPLNELTIAKLFAKHPQYFGTFKSCNVGSKGTEWHWCGKCAKCLFAFIILSPYLYPDQLVEIFGHDLFADPDLLPLLLQLSGHADVKPFDCVGTFSEVNYALSLTIHQLQNSPSAKPLPYLLQYYLDHFGLVDLSKDLTNNFDEHNNLTPEQIRALKEALNA